MNLDKKLLVCESMLARLDAAMASAEAEVVHSGALEDYLRRLLKNLEAEQAELDHNLRAAVLMKDNSLGLSAERRQRRRKRSAWSTCTSR
jgi:hypothetical protein